MNNDLISRDYVADKICDLYSDGEKATKKDRIINEVLDIIDNAPTVENITVFTESTDEKAIADLKEELQKVVAEKRPQGEWYEHIDKGLLKARHGNYVVYDVDYLLDNLAREVNLMESVRQMKGGAE